jgi:class 3 adenylate cyclase/tetratricopeptide (TPR) repeat protein
MHCPACSGQSPDGARFCNQCGAPLAAACASCGQQNPPGARFCNGCGAALAGEAPSGEVAPDGERRQLTVLFCDLVGSTELSGKLDPEDYRELVRGYQARADQAVERFGGHVAQHLGDGLLVYFGWPRAFDDAAERAVHAGLALVDPRTADPGLHLRVGIHTGPVVVSELGSAGHKETLALGETPNLAARVQALATPDTVWMTAATQRLASGMFVVEDQGEHALKGVREPVRVYRAVAASGLRSRLAATTAARGLTPFVGRDQERQLLLARFEQAREGEGQAVLLSGEPGIGKSRLLQQLREDLAGTHHTWIECAASPFFASTPFHTATDLLRSSFSFSPELSPADRIAGLERALAAAGLHPAVSLPLLAPLLDLALPPSYPPSPLSPEQQRKRLLATLVRWTLWASSLQPTVIATEDLHWVDPSTLELIGLLAEQGATSKLLLVQTARPEFRAPWPPRAHHTQITLSRLGRRHARALVEAVSGPARSSERVLDTLVERADGVPLFLEELVRAVVEDALDGVAPAAIPTTLQDSLMARLDRLGPAREVAQTASVLGRDFDFALLQAVSGLPDDKLELALASLADAELLYARGLPPESTYLFKHTLMQDAAYQSLLRTRRRELHRAAAEALVKRSEAKAAEHPELLAQHWEAAGETHRAVAEFKRAGDRARYRHALAEAERHYTHAIELLAGLPQTTENLQQELALQIPLAVVLGVTRGYASSEHERSTSRAQALFEHLGGAKDAMVLLSEAAGKIARGDLQATHEAAERLLEAGLREASHSATTWAHYLTGMVAFHVGDLARAQEDTEQAVACLREEDYAGSTIRPGPLIHDLLARVLVERGFPERAEAKIQRGLEMAARSDSPTDRFFGWVNATYAYVHLHDAGSTIRCLERAYALLGLEDRPPFWVAQAQIYGAWAHAMQSEPQPAVAELRQAIDAHLAQGPRSTFSFSLGLLAEVELLAGHASEGLATIERAIAATSESRIHLPELLRLRGELRAACGEEPALVEADLREAIAHAHEMGARLQELRAATSLARHLARSDRAAEGRELVAPLYAAFTEGFGARDLVVAKALLDELG